MGAKKLSVTARSVTMRRAASMQHAPAQCQAAALSAHQSSNTHI